LAVLAVMVQFVRVTAPKLENSATKSRRVRSQSTPDHR
jgi:hypothetical protein